jgi:hypothetical protein
MAIKRPELERQRTIIRLMPHRIQNSHWAGFSSFGGTPSGVLSYDGSLLVFGPDIFVIGGIFELLADALPWRVYRSDSALVSVVMKFGPSLPVTGGETFVMSTSPTVGQGTLEIIDGANWEFKAPRQPIPLGVGNHSWEVHAMDASGETHVCYVGELLVTT